MKKENLEEKNIMAEIAKAIMKLNYGEVRIIIHDAKIVQIEKIEKKRFQN
ncbi:YezD family protein [bacterium]|nr:YezD family protein [bacterium]